MFSIKNCFHKIHSFYIEITFMHNGDVNAETYVNSIPKISAGKFFMNC